MKDSTQFVSQLFGLDGQVIVVIGGTGVLGGALALGIAQAGAHVVVAGAESPRADSRVKEIGDSNCKASFCPVDVTSRTSVDALLADTLAKHGRVDGLVNCAGVNYGSTYVDIDDDSWEKVFAINMRGVHLACQAFAKHWIEAKKPGAIVNIGSVTASRPLSRVFAYGASKAGVINLTQNLARELAPYGIRVNGLCPGFFPAEQNRAILSPERTKLIMEHTPMARFGEPSELVGPMLLLLAPNGGSFVNGAVLYVDGGFTATTF